MILITLKMIKEMEYKIPEFDHNYSNVEFHLSHVSDSTFGSKMDENDILSIHSHWWESV